MKKYEEQLSEDAALLDQDLKQYKRCIDRKKSLERRKKEIIWELDHPLKGISYDGMSHGSGESVGCAAISFRLDEIKTRIEEQKEKAVKVLADIMDVIEFLPENSMERAIIEHKYIDRQSWKRICGIENISRTPATKYWRKGLYELLEFKKVQQIVHEYEKEKEAINFAGNF